MFCALCPMHSLVSNCDYEFHFFMIRRTIDQPTYFVFIRLFMPTEVIFLGVQILGQLSGSGDLPSGLQMLYDQAEAWVQAVNIPLILPLTKCLMTSSPDLITSISLDLYQSAGKSEFRFRFDWIIFVYKVLFEFFLTFSPLYRPVPPALGSPFLRLKPPS